MLGLFIALLLFVFSALHIFIIETPDYESNHNFSNSLQASKMTGLCSFANFYSNTLIIRLKDESQNDEYKKTKHEKFSEN